MGLARSVYKTKVLLSLIVPTVGLITPSDEGGHTWRKGTVAIEVADSDYVVATASPHLGATTQMSQDVLSSEASSHSPNEQPVSGALHIVSSEGHEKRLEEKFPALSSNSAAQQESTAALAQAASLITVVAPATADAESKAAACPPGMLVPFAISVVLNLALIGKMLFASIASSDAPLADDPNSAGSERGGEPASSSAQPSAPVSGGEASGTEAPKPGVASTEASGQQASEAETSGKRGSVLQDTDTVSRKRRSLLEEGVWEKYSKMENPNMFKFLAFSKDSGFKDVKNLYDWTRLGASGIMVGFVVINVLMVTALDISLLINEKKALEHIDKDGEIAGGFYFSKWGLDHIGLALSGYMAPFGPSKLLAFLELCGLFVYLSVTLRFTIMAIFCEGYKKWSAIAEIFFDLFPFLSTYSGIKLMNYIVPNVMQQTFKQRVASLNDCYEQGLSIGPEIWQWVRWGLILLGSFIVGFDTFLLKLRIASASSHLPTWIESMFPAFQFLAQVLGIVQLGPFTRERLFMFVFGGEDGVLQEQELELMDVWNALITRRMYQDLSPWEFFIVLTSFSDDDFQRLVLDEDEEMLKEECSFGA